MHQLHLINFGNKSRKMNHKDRIIKNRFKYLSFMYGNLKPGQEILYCFLNSRNHRI